MGCSDCNSSASSSGVKYLTRGESIRFFVNIYEPVDNSALEPNCSPGRNDIVIPCTLNISSATVNIYFKTDLVNPVIPDTATITSIFDSNSVLIGFKISYVVDTTAIELSENGQYLLVFTYTEDSTGTFMLKIPFSINALTFC